MPAKSGGMINPKSSTARQKTGDAQQGEAAGRCSRALPLALAAQGKAPQWVMLLPAGRIETNDGRAWYNSDPDGIVAAYLAGGLHLPFDFEHASEIRAPDGDYTPMAGWIIALENRAGVIWGEVEWTERGRAAIEAREVRYVSPAIRYNPETGQILALSSAALTVRPAMPSLPAISSRQGKNNPEPKTPDPKTTENLPMDKKALCAALALPEDASDQAVLASIASLKAPPAMTTPATPGTIALAAHQAVVAERDAALQALASRDVAALKVDVDATLALAMSEGKIMPVQRDYYAASCSSRTELDRFKAFLSTAPVLVAGKAGADAHADKGEMATLSATDKKVARAMGISEADFLKTRIARQAAAKEGEAV